MKELIFPEDSQMNRGVFSPAVKVDLGTASLIFVSGQQALKDEDNTVITSDVTEQTEQIFQQLESILVTSEASFDDVVKVQIFLTDMADYESVSQVRNKYLASAKPASTLVSVSGMTRVGAKVEIDLVAVKQLSK